MKGKASVYSWRITPTLKARLHEAARLSGRSVAQLLDDIVAERLEADDRAAVAEVERQRTLHLRASRWAGRLSGADPDRSAKARVIVQARLRGRLRRAR